MSAHGEEGNEREHPNLATILDGLSFLLKEHRKKILDMEEHLVFMKEQLQQDNADH
jgi:hypothetical protein